MPNTYTQRVPCSLCGRMLPVIVPRGRSWLRCAISKGWRYLRAGCGADLMCCPGCRQSRWGGRNAPDGAAGFHQAKPGSGRRAAAKKEAS